MCIYLYVSSSSVGLDSVQVKGEFDLQSMNCYLNLKRDPSFTAMALSFMFLWTNLGIMFVVILL